MSPPAKTEVSKTEVSKTGVSKTGVRGSGPGGRVTRNDIEAKLREITGQVERGVEAAKPKLMPAIAAAAAGVVVLAYVLGRRRGRRRSTVVEIRRV